MNATIEKIRVQGQGVDVFDMPSSLRIAAVSTSAMDGFLTLANEAVNYQPDLIVGTELLVAGPDCTALDSESFQHAIKPALQLVADSETPMVLGAALANTPESAASGLPFRNVALGLSPGYDRLTVIEKRFFSFHEKDTLGFPLRSENNRGQPRQLFPDNPLLKNLSFLICSELYWFDELRDELPETPQEIVCIGYWACKDILGRMPSDERLAVAMDESVSYMMEEVPIESVLFVDGSVGASQQPFTAQYKSTNRAMVINKKNSIF